MIEMGLTPPAWRALSREDREYLLAVKRIARGMESQESYETENDKPGKPQPPAQEVIA